jgi:arylsulfatase A-like enzyme
MKRSQRPLVAALALIAAAAVQCMPRGEPSIRVVLITLDTLRLDSLLGTGDRPEQMPRLRRWAERGRVFERYYSATSSTKPSHATLFTGLNPWEHGVPSNFMVLTDERVTLAERLRDAGFRTAAAVGSFAVNSKFGFDQGFETYHDHVIIEGAEGTGDEARPTLKTRFRAQEVTDTALTLLDDASGSRQFFWFHYFDAHTPYGGSTGRKGHLGSRDLVDRIAEGSDPQQVLGNARRLYDRDVGYLDEALDRLLVRIFKDDEKMETHVVVVSDHGESFGEGGSVGHGKRLTSVVIHVPCFVISPRVTPGASTEPVGTTDLTTTILSLAGVAGDAPGGRDLLDPGARPTQIVGMRRTYQTPFRELRTDGSVHVHDGLRFYVLDGPDLITGDSQGPLTLNDTSEPLADPDRAEAARRLFAQFEKEFVTEVRARDDEETLERLRALGYVP